MAGGIDAATWTDAELAVPVIDMQGLTLTRGDLPALRSMSTVPPAFAAGVEQRDLRAGDIGLTLFRPRNAPAGLPCVYWIHGGGMIVGDRHMDDATLNRWCLDLGCAFLSVDYRLAPEAAYPLPIEDCDAGLMYLFEHGQEWGLDLTRVGIGGRSAGGGLAAGLALRLRDRGDRRLRFQYLEYPMLDDRQTTRSSQLDDLAIWSRESNTFGWRSYLGAWYGKDSVPNDAVPARASHLKDLPPAFLCVGTADGFYDEVVDYSVRLNAAAVPSELHVYAGAPHGFHLFSDSHVTHCAEADSTNWLRRQLMRPEPQP
ncbi:MAG TPA: alpha/beta hydrolase [Frankiaceae bacterium]|jgi:acetyl esterase/lipase|nr:alpha/beta hydrolase [Frankiaceae bacterium]